MHIEWNKVTWYSKFLAVALFVGTFWIAFCLGIKYEKASYEFIKQDSPNLPDNQPVSGALRIKVGENKSLGNFRISFNKVISDSRCPSDVQCIWAGEFKLEATFSNNGQVLTKVFSSEEQITFSGFKVSVRDVYPVPNSKKQINSKDYEVVFDIVKN